MDLVAWFVFGLIVGIVANMVDPGPVRGSIIGSIVFGILGAIAGGFVANMVFGLDPAGFNIESLVIAILGGVFVIVLGKAFRRAV